MLAPRCLRVLENGPAFFLRRLSSLAHFEGTTPPPPPLPLRHEHQYEESHMSDYPHELNRMWSPSSIIAASSSVTNTSINGTDTDTTNMNATTTTTTYSTSASSTSNTAKRWRTPRLPEFSLAPETIKVALTVPEIKELLDDVFKSVQESVQKNDGNRDACVVGFDVEYSSKKKKGKNSKQPAVLQIATPTLVGIIWLDKLEQQGRNVMKDPVFALLTLLLCSPDVTKVGCSAKGDAGRLTRWWWQNGTCLNGFVDLNKISDERVYGKSLKVMSENILGKWLSKRKGGGGKNFWRRAELSEKMKTYAACDAACSLFVWMKLKGIEF